MRQSSFTNLMPPFAWVGTLVFIGLISVTCVQMVDQYLDLKRAETSKHVFISPEKQYVDSLPKPKPVSRFDYLFLSKGTEVPKVGVQLGSKLFGRLRKEHPSYAKKSDEEFLSHVQKLVQNEVARAEETVVKARASFFAKLTDYTAFSVITALAATLFSYLVVLASRSHISRRILGKATGAQDAHLAASLENTEEPFISDKIDALEATPVESTHTATAERPLWLKGIVCLCMLFPTGIAIGLYVYLLSIIGPGDEPERVIGLLGAATWTASCGVYLSSRKFYYAAALFAITSVVTYSS